MKAILKLEQLLKDAGLKVTRNRVAVLKLLSVAEKPVNHSDIMQNLPSEKNWDRVTIYRTLSEFEDKSIVKSLHSNNRVKYYELQDSGVKSHGHIVCDSCGKIDCLEGELFPKISSEIKGHKVHNVEVLIRGLCKHCQ